MDQSIELDRDAVDLSNSPSLSSLPLEIKARIVELASLQDAEFKERWRAGVPGHEMTQVVRTPWHGRSLSSLSQTCLDFNSLASMHIFRTMTVEKIDTAYFMLRILPRRAHNVRVVEFLGVSADVVQIQKALGILHLFPNLDELRINSYNITSLSRIGEAEAVLSAEVLRLVAPRIAIVHCADFTPTSATTFLKGFTSLRSVTVDGFNDGQHELERDDLHVLRDTLAAMPRLAQLILPVYGVLDPGILGATWVAPIRTLKLLKTPIDATVLALISSFSPLLEHLTLQPTLQNVLLPLQAPLFTTSFPSLTSLSLIDITCGNAQALLTSFSPAAGLDLSQLDTASPIPHNAPLRSISISVIRNSEMDTATFYKALAAFTHLRELRIATSRGEPLTQIARKLEGICDRRRITLSTDSKEDPFLLRASVDSLRTSSNEPMYKARVGVRYRALKKTLEFGLRSLERMKAYEDIEQMETAFKVLADLHGWQMLEDD
ncbi:hypothetical protein RQP46_006989 [Phenoliferia psychrophenolica]